MKKRKSFDRVSNVIMIAIVVAAVVFAVSTKDVGFIFVWSLGLLVCCFVMQIISVDEKEIIIKWPLNIFRKARIFQVSEIDSVFIETVMKSRWIKFGMRDGTEQTVIATLSSYDLRRFQRYLEALNIKAEINSFYW